MNQNEFAKMSPRERTELEKVIFEEWTVEGKQETLEIKKDESPKGRSGKKAGSSALMSPSPTQGELEAAS